MSLRSTGIDDESGRREQLARVSFWLALAQGAFLVTVLTIAAFGAHLERLPVPDRVILAAFQILASVPAPAVTRS